MSAYKILGLGDSITVGNHGSGNAVVASYRLHLSKYVAGLRASAAGAALLPDGVQFVGATTTAYTPPVAPSAADMPWRGNYAKPWDGFPEGVDNKHSGVGSETIAQVVARKADVTTYAPNAVVFECGTNDVATSAYVTTTTANAWAQAIRDVCALLAPGGVVIATDLPPLHNGTVASADAQKAAAFCREMHQRVATLRSEGLPVQLASIHRRLPIAYGFADGVHPSRRGFEVFATVILGALMRHLTGNANAMTIAQEIECASAIASRVRVLAARMGAVWQLQSADSTGIYAPKSAETAALAAIATGAQRVVGVASQASQDRDASIDALIKLTAADAVVLSQYAAGGSSAVTDAALEDAVYIALPRVWGITVSQWARP